MENKKLVSNIQVKRNNIKETSNTPKEKTNSPHLSTSSNFFWEEEEVKSSKNFFKNSLLNENKALDFNNSSSSSNILDLHFPIVNKRLFRESPSNYQMYQHSPNNINHLLNSDYVNSNSHPLVSHQNDNILKHGSSSGKPSIVQKLNFENYSYFKHQEEIIDNQIETNKKLEKSNFNLKQRIFSDSSASIENYNLSENSFYKSKRSKKVKSRRRKLSKSKSKGKNLNNPQIVLENLSKVDKPVKCTCKKSQCLKLYCECFALGNFCDENCQCYNCMNIEINEEIRYEKMKQMKIKHPYKFEANVNKGCNCTKSGCRKGYCECFVLKRHCTKQCRCIGCKNTSDKNSEITLNLSDPNTDPNILISRFSSFQEKVQKPPLEFKTNTISVSIQNNKINIDENYDFKTFNKEHTITKEKKKLSIKLFESVKQNTTPISKKRLFSISSSCIQTTKERTRKKPRLIKREKHRKVIKRKIL